ncbi:MAG: hypothetical protein MJZ41_01800 [Bacteroidaceae bacterium]|nr:hypothetical protein [Bacteroidaceae bacterium]
MELPANLFGSVAEEGDIYFFTSDCPVGIADHMHVCVKHANKIILLSTCSSKIDTAMRIAMLQGYDMNTFPVFTQTEENKFRKPQTYVNCNKVVELTEEEFGNLVKTCKIHKLSGNIGKIGLSLIAKGINLSPDIEGRIKRLF